MRYFGATLLLVLFCFSALAESNTISIPLRHRGGVFEVQATLNSEIKAYFVIDSGAADVTISEAIAKLLAGNESLSKADVVGGSNYQLADGSSSSGLAITIRKLELGGIVLNNVRAVVMKGTDVPLLLGQSALKQFERWSINQERSTLDIYSNSTIGEGKAPPTKREGKSPSDGNTITRNWVRIARTDDVTTFVDRSSLRKSGAKGSIWKMDDYKVRQEGGYVLAGSKEAISDHAALMTDVTVGCLYPPRSASRAFTPFATWCIGLSAQYLSMNFAMAGNSGTVTIGYLA